MNLAVIIDNLPRFAAGLALTLEITVISVLIGFCMALPLALLRVSRKPLLWMPVYGYIFYFRGTPLLVQLFLIYYGSGQFRDQLEAIGLWGFFREPIYCAVLSLTLNTAAYGAEILRGAIQAVQHGEIEAARACGMSGSLLYRRIILPKAFQVGLPAYTNEIVFLFQATSLVSIISLLDLTGVARILISRSFAAYEIWVFTGAVYLVVSYAIIWLSGKLEHHWSGHLRDRPDAKLAPGAIKQAVVLR